MLCWYIVGVGVREAANIQAFTGTAVELCFTGCPRPLLTPLFIAFVGFFRVLGMGFMAGIL